MKNFVTIDQMKEFIVDNVPQVDLQQNLVALLTNMQVNDLSSDEKRTLYTSRDTTDVRDYIIQSIIALNEQLNLDNKWTDFNESDTGMVLVELLAGFADMLGFYLDKQTLECFIGSVKQRRNAAAQFELINYSMYMTKSALTTGRFTLDQAQSATLHIPQYTQVEANLNNNNRIFYATSRAAAISIGELSVDVPLIQGKVKKSLITVGELYETQKIRIIATDVAHETMRVIIDGMEWTRVPDVLIDDEPGRKFSVFEDKRLTPYVLFHNTYKDYLPTDNSINAEFIYIESLGAEGKVQAGAVNHISDRLYVEGDDITSHVSITNLDAASGGASRETVDHARVQAPKTLSMLGKAVTLLDFHDMIMEQPGVLKCQALDWSIPGNYVTAPYIVHAFVVPTDTDYASEQHLLDITNYFTNNNKLASVKLFVFNANYVVVDVEAEVYATVDDSQLDGIKKTVEDAVRAYFQPANLTFGEGVKPSNITTLIETSSNLISYTRLISPTDSTNLNLTQFPKLGELKITVQKTINYLNAVST